MYCHKRIPIPGVLCHRLTELTELPGKGTGFLQKFQKFRVRERKSHRSSIRSRYCGTSVQHSQKFQACKKMLYPYPGYCEHGRTELQEVSGTGMNVVHNFQIFRVRVLISYRTYRSSFVGKYPGYIPPVGFASTLQNTTYLNNDRDGRKYRGSGTSNTNSPARGKNNNGGYTSSTTNGNSSKDSNSSRPESARERRHGNRAGRGGRRRNRNDGKNHHGRCNYCRISTEHGLHYSPLRHSNQERDGASQFPTGIYFSRMMFDHQERRFG